MAKRIPQQFIDDLLNRIDIVSLIGSRMELRKAGREYSARCPFHDERTPSFTISPNKQFYHCFGCGAHGNALGFLMDYDRLEFRDAVEELASMAGVDVPMEAASGPTRDLRDDYSLMEQAERFYRQSLAKHDEAIRYLKERGLNRDVVNRFRIGFAPAGWSSLLDRLGNHEALIRNGLAIQGDRGAYDRFRNRVMFPIRDTRGRVIAFGGRRMGGDEDGPKYLNSPETDLFHKGRHLYGLYEARQVSTELSQLLVVEGYMDVVALSQHGIHFAVATLGTATTEEHLSTLFRYTAKVVFCFDGDSAGQRAAWRAMERALGVIRDGREVSFLFLPEGEDPDSLVRSQGAEHMTAMLKKAQPLSRLLLDGLRTQVDLSSMDGRAHLVELARPHLQRVRIGVFRTLLVNQLATLVGLERLELEGLLSSSAPAVMRSNAGRGRAAHDTLTPVRLALLRLLERPALAKTVEHPEALRETDVAGAAFLCEVIEFLKQHPNYHIGSILEHWRERPEGVHLARLATVTLPAPEAGVEREFHDAIEHLLASARDKRLETLLEKGNREELSPEEKDELRQLLRNPPR